MHYRAPNMATRYLGWTSLKSLGASAEPRLQELYRSDNPRMKARALWLLSQLDKGDSYLEDAFSSDNEDIRITALRSARAYNSPVLMNLLAGGVEDPSVQVRREVAIALRTQENHEVPKLLAGLVESYPGGDPWYLEALGIGSALKASEVFDMWQKSTKLATDSDRYREIVWRLRTDQAVAVLGKLIVDPQTQDVERRKYFRALDFQPADSRDQVLVSILRSEMGADTEIQSLVLNHISPNQVASTPEVEIALASTLSRSKGTSQYIDLVKRFKLRTEADELLNMMFCQASWTTRN